MTDSNQVTEATIARTRKRIARLPDRELMDWAEVSLPGMMRQLEAYRRSGDDGHLTELMFQEMQFNLVLTQLIDNHAARRDEGLPT